MRFVRNDLRTTHIDPLYGPCVAAGELPVWEMSVTGTSISPDMMKRLETEFRRLYGVAKVVHPVVLPPEWEPAVKSTPKLRRKRD